MEWANVDYNLGNFFDGTYFTVPENGLYSFHACCRHFSRNIGRISLKYGGSETPLISAEREYRESNIGYVKIDTTVKLVKNSKVNVPFSGDLFNTNHSGSTWFEGRMIARLDE